MSCFSDKDSSSIALLIELVEEGKKITEDLNFGVIKRGEEKTKATTKVDKSTIINGLRQRTRRNNRLDDSRYVDSLAF